MRQTDAYVVLYAPLQPTEQTDDSIGREAVLALMFVRLFV
jgi:hypothetical protein